MIRSEALTFAVVAALLTSTGCATTAPEGNAGSTGHEYEEQYKRYLEMGSGKKSPYEMSVGEIMETMPWWQEPIYGLGYFVGLTAMTVAEILTSRGYPPYESAVQFPEAY